MQLVQPIFDSHAHYDDHAFDPDRTNLLSSLPNAGIQKVVSVGSDLPSSAANARLAQEYPFLYHAAGIHPSCVAPLPNDYKETLQEIMRSPKAVALGEIGLDYHYGKENAALQRKIFTEQMQLAQEKNWPVIIHSREATQDTLAILEQFPSVCGVVHCFSGSVPTAERLLQLGYYIGFTGIITFANAKKAVLAAKAIPLHRLLVETDCPYMTPVPHRGRRCNSTMLQETVAKLAEIHQITPLEMANHTYQNACHLFRIQSV